MTELPKKPFPQWKEPPVHSANTAPKMSDDELRELADDIKKHGMHEPIILWRDNREEANRSKGPFPVFLLDGVNRLAALKLLGITTPENAPTGSIVECTVRTLDAIKQVGSLGRQSVSTGWVTDCDPVAFHVSMNAFRRHLLRIRSVG